mmetsp:Transcript_1835/g.3819  ORF Transcript_1835/g.3819 Transcript_1835/m.3819 type:complete len:470 (+) Transcript_1835:3-1412(+)
MVQISYCRLCSVVWFLIRHICHFMSLFLRAHVATLVVSTLAVHISAGSSLCGEKSECGTARPRRIQEVEDEDDGDDSVSLLSMSLRRGDEDMQNRYFSSKLNALVARIDAQDEAMSQQRRQLESNLKLVEALTERVDTLEAEKESLTKRVKLYEDTFKITDEEINIEKHIKLTGANLQISAGRSLANGNLVIGQYHDFSGATNSFVAGMQNTIVGDAVVAVGGKSCKASGNSATVVGGYNNKAIGSWSSAIGGRGNQATGRFSTVGGMNNLAAGESSSALGGSENVAAGERSVAFGGFRNRASGLHSAATGGWEMEAAGEFSSVSGGLKGIAVGKCSSIIGGDTGKALGYGALVAGGRLANASGNFALVAGGYQNSASGDETLAAGGFQTAASGSRASTFGGRLLEASDAFSVASGDKQLASALDPNAKAASTLLEATAMAEASHTEAARSKNAVLSLPQGLEAIAGSM